MVVYPKYITLKRWAASLFEDYPNEQLPILQDEEKWVEWAMIVANTGEFKQKSVPPPFFIQDNKKVSNFEKWEDWAKIVYLVMLDQYAISEIIQ